MIPDTDTDALLATIEDPVLFTRGVLQDDPWAKQEEILRALARPHARVAVKACHASGKTHIAAAAVLWFLTLHQDAIVVTTAPTWPQVKLLLWGEIHAALRRARITYPAANTTDLTLARDNYAIGLSTDEGVRFQGFHSGHLLIVLDEAPGVRPDIWEAIEGARAGGDVRILALGNPTIASGPFYDAFTAHRAGWSTISISGFDTPNLAGVSLEALQAMDLHDPALAVAPRPYLTTRQWLREKWDEWGRHGHPLWSARCLGQFPAQAEDALISLSWIEQAALTLAPDDGTAVEAGVDVAGPGEDETVLCVRQGPRVLWEQWWPTPDPRGELVAALGPYRDRLVRVKVDSAGIGYYLATHLHDLGLPVDFVNVGEAAHEPEQYVNRKAELYWALRMRFEAGDVVGPLSETTKSQLAGIRWKTDARGRTVIESKDDARKRGVKSPDRAEAVMLAFAPAAQVGLLEFLKTEVAERRVRDEAAQKERPYAA